MSQLSYLFGSLLELIYNVIGDYAISIIVFTVVVKLLLLPLTLTQTKSMKSMQLIQPKMDEIKKYGLNQYFLRAILTENYYTLDTAHKLIQDFLNNY